MFAIVRNSIAATIQEKRNSLLLSQPITATLMMQFTHFESDIESYDSAKLNFFGGPGPAEAWVDAQKAAAEGVDDTGLDTLPTRVRSALVGQRCV